MAKDKFYDYGMGEHVHVLIWGDIVECEVIGHDEPTKQVRLGYMPGCGTGSFYTTPAKLIEAENIFKNQNQ